MAGNQRELKVISTAKNPKNPYSKDIITDPRGQWAHPGEITKIPSGNITMQGVPYPVLGVDNLGNQQLMHPGLDYTFPGQSVTEYPQMPIARNGGSTGGWMDKYQDGGQNIPLNKTDKYGNPITISAEYGSNEARPHLEPRTNTAYASPRMSSDELERFIAHENRHAWQNKNGRGTFDIAHNTENADYKRMVNPPQMMATDDVWNNYYDRKSKEVDYDVDNFVHNNSSFSMVPDAVRNVVYDKMIDQAQYGNPNSKEGEASLYEWTGLTPEEYKLLMAAKKTMKSPVKQFGGGLDEFASGGNISLEKAQAFLDAGGIYGHPLSQAQEDYFQSIVDADDDNDSSSNDTDEDEMRYGGLKRHGKRTTTNPMAGINRLMLPNEQYHTPKGRLFVPPHFQSGGEQFPQMPVQNYNPSETVQSQAMPYINNVPQVLPVKQVAKPGIDLSKLSKQEQIDYGINKVAEREKPEKRKALETLLRTTSWMENNYGSNPKAYNRGYTNSFMSLDDIALKDMFTGKGDKGAYTKGQLEQLKRLNELGLPKTQDEFKKLLKKDDTMASLAGARMVYGSSPEQLPDPNNPEKVFDYYYKYYNKAGASKYGNREKDYNRFLEGYKQYGPKYKQKKDGGSTSGWLDKYK